MDISKLAPGLSGYTGPEIDRSGDTSSGQRTGSPAGTITSGIHLIRDRYTASSTTSHVGDAPTDTVDIRSSAVASTGDARSHRIAEIRSAIANGDYHVPVHAVAEAVLGSMTSSSRGVVDATPAPFASEPDDLT